MARKHCQKSNIRGWLCNATAKLDKLAINFGTVLNVLKQKALFSLWVGTPDNHDLQAISGVCSIAKESDLGNLQSILPMSLTTGHSSYLKLLKISPKHAKGVETTKTLVFTLG